MLVECGFVKAETSDGREFTFTPSLARIAALGDPHEIVACFAALHGPNAAPEAAYVLACLCDQDDPSPLIGCREPEGWTAGLMPAAEQIVIARHLLRHGMVGKAKPGAAGREQAGKYAETFDAAEYIAAATVHLGLSEDDAAGLSMTDFQIRFAMKFPDAKNRERDVPTREEYDAGMARLKERSRG